MPDNHGKFVLMQSPGALPGTCGGCGKATCPQGFIDTGFDADFYGVIYYCYECVLDMASKFGFIGPEVAEQLRTKLAELEIEAATQRAAILGLENTIDGLLQVRDSGASNLTVPNQPESDIQPETEEVTPSEIAEVVGYPISEEPDYTVTAGDSEINDNAGEQGAVGIPDDNGLASWAELSL